MKPNTPISFYRLTEEAKRGHGGPQPTTHLPRWRGPLSRKEPPPREVFRNREDWVCAGMGLLAVLLGAPVVWCVVRVMTAIVEGLR
jgi:hypothetical protein